MTHEAPQHRPDGPQPERQETSHDERGNPIDPGWATTNADWATTGPGWAITTPDWLPQYINPPNPQPTRPREPDQSTNPPTPFGLSNDQLSPHIGSAFDSEEQEASEIANKPIDPHAKAPREPLTEPNLPPIPGLSTSGGTKLPQTLKTEFEIKHGKTLDHIELHDNPQTHAQNKHIGAQAFTYGNRIYAGESMDTEILRHEMGHLGQRNPKVRRWSTRDDWAAAARERQRQAAIAAAARAERLRQNRAAAQKRLDIQRQSASQAKAKKLAHAKTHPPTADQQRLLKVQQSQQKAQAIWQNLPPDAKQTKIALDAQKTLYAQWLETSQTVLGKGEQKGLEQYFNDNARTLHTLEWIVKSTQTPDSFNAHRFKDYLAPPANPRDKVELIALKQNALKDLVDQDTPAGKRVWVNGSQIVRAITKPNAQGKPVTEYFVKAGSIEDLGSVDQTQAQWVKITPPTPDQRIVTLDATELTQGKQPKELNATVNISGGEAQTKKRYNTIDQNYPDHINPTFTQYQQLRGDTPRQLSGSSLRNELGVAMNFTPNNVPLTETEQRALKDGNWDLFSPDKISPDLAQSMTPQQQEKLRTQLKQQHEALIKVEGKVKEIGGDNAKVTTLPIMVDSPELGGVIQVPLFRVTGKDGKDRFVDNTGREYDTFEDWKDNNKLPPGRVSYFADGHISSKPDGQPNLVTEQTHAVKDTVWEHMKPWVDGAAIVGGVLLAGAAIVFSGGAATPAVAAAAMAWGGAGLAAYGLANGGSSLYDRYDHGESLSFADAEARAAWIEVAGSAAGFAAIGASMRATSAAMKGAGSTDEVARAANLQRTATGINGVSDATDVLGLTNSTYDLASNWENLSPEQRLTAIGQIGFWGGMMGAGRMRAQGQQAQAPSPYAAGEVDQYMQMVGAGPRPRLEGQGDAPRTVRPMEPIPRPGETMEQRVMRRARETRVEGQPSMDELLARRQQLIAQQRQQQEAQLQPETQVLKVEEAPVKSPEVIRREQELSQALPKRQQVPVEIDPNLQGNAVRVHYSVDKKGLITDIQIKAGANATPKDIQLHGTTVKRMQQYSGLSRHVQRMKDQWVAWRNDHGVPPVGSRAWEAQLEISKLPDIIQERVERLSNAGLDPKSQQRLESEITDLKQQLAEHQKTFKAMDKDPGQGFVAAKDKKEKDFGDIDFRKIFDSTSGKSMEGLSSQEVEKSFLLWKQDMASTARVNGKYGDFRYGSFDSESKKYHAIRSNVDQDGTLEFTIASTDKDKRREQGKNIGKEEENGADLFARMMIFHRGKVKRIQAHWTDYNEQLTDNFDTFKENQYILNNEQAAKQTFTGRMAEKFGFSRIVKMETVKDRMGFEHITVTFEP